MIPFEPPSHPKPKRHRPEPPVPRYTLLISLSLLLLSGALWLWQSQSPPVAARGNARASVPSKLSAAPSKTLPRRVTRNIEEVRLGDWVLAKNPELAAEDRPPELDHRRPDNLRALSLRLQKEDDSWLDLQLLRSPDWLEEHQQGNAVYVDLEELGAKGWAELLAVDPCPAIGPRPHPDCRLVTGRFIHQSADTFDLAITDAQGQPRTTIGLTDNHPIWSVDRQQFVPAGSLAIGEQLTDTRGETLKVGSIQPRAGPEPVYNLEVDVEHVYFVSDAGILVHNTCVPRLQPYRDDVLVKGVHADILKNGRKVTEARLGVVDGQLRWFRWGDLVTNKKTLNEADKAIAGMLDDVRSMTAARDQVRHAIGELQSNLRHGTKHQKDFATRDLPSFQETLGLLNNLLD